MHEAAIPEAGRWRLGVTHAVIEASGFLPNANSSTAPRVARPSADGEAGSPAVSQLGRFSIFVSRDSRTMPIDQAVIDRFVDDYPTELPLTDAQRGWLMRVKAAHHGGKPCTTACDTVNWESCDRK
jgi:hypothetical protein